MVSSSYLRPTSRFVIGHPATSNEVVCDFNRQAATSIGSYAAKKKLRYLSTDHSMSMFFAVTSVGPRRTSQNVIGWLRGQFRMRDRLTGIPRTKRGEAILW